MKTYYIYFKEVRLSITKYAGVLFIIVVGSLVKYVGKEILSTWVRPAGSLEVYPDEEIH